METELEAKDSSEESNLFASLPVIEVAKNWQVNGALTQGQQIEAAALCVSLVHLANEWIKKDGQLAAKESSERKDCDSCILASFQCLAPCPKTRQWLMQLPLM